jgi:pyruvate/2-oxoglutarate dehydrogenase complex dihydrolipoamide acyltransferase (E2) component
MKLKIRLGRVGMNMQEATVSAWMKKPGERFEKGDPLYAIETEKVVQEITATAPGTLVEIFVEAGQNAAVGDVLCIVDVEEKRP